MARLDFPAGKFRGCLLRPPRRVFLMSPWVIHAGLRRRLGKLRGEKEAELDELFVSERIRGLALRPSR